MALIEMCFKKLNEIQNKCEPDSQPIISLLNMIADLAKIEREWIFDDTEEVLAAIASVNFSVAKAVDDVSTADKNNNNNESISLQDYHYQLVTQLVNSELCDLPQALKITSEQPFKDVEGILKARIKFLNRDQEAKEKQEKERQDIGQSIAEQLNDGSFFGDGFQDAIASAINGDNEGLGGLL
ncbi:MAG: hypothetical protein ACRC1Z_18220 [Waterburya sp.]